MQPGFRIDTAFLFLLAVIVGGNVGFILRQPWSYLMGQGQFVTGYKSFIIHYTERFPPKNPVTDRACVIYLFHF